MRENLGVRDAVGILKSGPAKGPQFRLVLPPGLTLAAIADRVGMLQGHNRDTFLQVAQSGAVRSKYQPAERDVARGLLLPRHVFRLEDETDQQILQPDSCRRSIRRPTRSGSRRPQRRPGMTPYQTVVAASLIETRGEARRGPAADLGRDPQPPCGGDAAADRRHPVLREGRLPRRSRPNADKQLDSPYNTYKVGGPAAHADLERHREVAAGGPEPGATVPYLYYVLSDKNGKHKFATTPAEHEQERRGGPRRDCCEQRPGDHGLDSHRRRHR